ncbi:hypothetical protein PSHT_00903 [Puccinia striiformis]|uniref:Uncharacterized protein n=1 Tax=Puccinia striiformis TaxID=27350 RepID=A0A2S4WLW3_9BASI|nr:hypothetical protein PSHT_00903 [Puccinia striiformis]
MHPNFARYNKSYTCNRTERPPSSLHGRYIVTLDRDKTKSLGEFIAHLDSKGVKHEVVLDMTELVPEVFYGASVRLSDEADLKHLEGSAHVEKISRVQKISRASTFDEKLVDAPINSTPSLYPPQLQTRITELHKMGLYGKGIKVALVDSAFGKNYAEDDNDDGDAEDGVTPHGYEPLAMRLTARGTKPKPKNESPCTQCTSHGTHVAGIVAASDVGYGFMGVAPNATLGMYRGKIANFNHSSTFLNADSFCGAVFGCGEDGDSSSDSLMAAFLQAHKDGADIISASIGGPGGWGNGEELVKIVNNLVQMKGAIVIVAAGNEGSEGLFYADDPASARSAISVGSVEAQAIVAGKFKASTGRELTLYRTSTLNLTGEHRVYITANSSHDPADACDELPKNTPNLTDHVVLVKRGTCLFSIKAKHVAAKGGKHILFYMNSTSIVTLPNTMKNATVAPISLSDGEYIYDQAKKDPSGFKVSFPPTGHFYLNVPDGGLPSNFSQYGPSFDLESPQPAVSAVGGNVVSTFPMNNGGYSSLSGTSMATPQRQEFYRITMRSRLATATKLLNRVNSPSLDSAVHQGGGLIDAFCAVWTNTTMSTSSLVLNDSVSFQGNQEFTISNNGTRNVSYILTHRQAVTLETFSAATKYNRPDIQPTSSNQLYRNVIDRGPNENSTANYPYLTYKKEKASQGGKNSTNATVSEQPALNTTFVWDLKKHNTTVLHFRTLFGSPLLRLDVMPGNAVLSNVTNSKDYEKSFMGSRLLGLIPDSDSVSFQRSTAGDSFMSPWNATVVTKEKEKPHFLHNGSYKVLFRALRVTGRKTNEADYDYWVSPEFNLTNSRG